MYNLTGGKDYGPGRYTIAFPAGVTSTLFNISITSDSVFERTETFHLTIVGRNLPNRVSLGDVHRTTVIIYDFGKSKYDNIILTVTTIMYLVLMFSAC